MTTFNFTTRETYIEWRNEWRTNYAELSKTIREQKHLFKEAQRKYETSSLTPAEYWRILANLMKSQKTAKEMMTYREQSKIEAARQRALRIEGEASCA